MAGDIDTSGLLLHQHHIRLAQFRQGGNGNCCGLVILVQHAKQAHLAVQVLLAGGCNTVHHAVINSKQFAAVMAEAVQRTAFDKVFYGTLVQLALIHSLQEFFHAAKWAVCCAFCGNGAD